MKLIALCILAVVAISYAHPLTEKSDSYDADEILGNRRLLLPYVKCALEQGKCTSNMKDMRSDIKKALTYKCAECTEKQKRDSRKVIKHMINHEPEFWQQIVEKYDPNRGAANDFEKEFKQ